MRYSLTRWRHRKGFGVHAPFAYNLIREVLYAKWPYHAYSDLRKLQTTQSSYPTAVNELLFRLANHFHPIEVVEVGTGGGIASCYLAAADSHIHCTTIDRQCHSTVQELLKKWQIDYKQTTNEVAWLEQCHTIHLAHIAHTPHYAAVYEALLPHLTPHSVIVVEGISENKAKRIWWQQVVNDDRVGDTYDLYTVGIVLLNRTHKKQNYKV